MSLSRTALRLCTIEALRPTAALPDGDFPTLAESYVFDSRFDPIADMAPAERRPIAIVFTEEDNGDPAQKAGGPPFKRIVDLVIELSVVAMVSENDEYIVVLPSTDAETEASLDLLEAQVRFALMYAPSGKLWRDLTGRRISDIRSLPHRTAEENIRLAERTLRLKVTIPDDDYDPAPAANVSGLDRLPNPLRDVIKALGGTAYGVALANALAASAPTMPAAVPLQTVGLNLDVADPSGARDDATDVEAVIDNLDQ